MSAGLAGVFAIISMGSSLLVLALLIFERERLRFLEIETTAGRSHAPIAIATLEYI